MPVSWHLRTPAVGLWVPVQECLLSSEGCMCDPEIKEDWNLSDLGASQAKDLSG